ncbi:NAD(P)H-dependent oxidoreductase [Verrucomicrobiaceae bacterium R5-34]|uniref:NAD(P)H-dependent oxidoreductase n=1 Tax=Oceaniferula flava TaxID=2800421 RepID=A0AAE2SCS5_9BACT|nr:NAD(P)H-dependent oxidoreductase [Oceaniferula flavus]MBK1830437.1 NAD(P)H-dependent oxidoreductase [Verrucomicrobiaceae bacterium R5-34]MBK1854529.1 NAD(P)H-dependent oxidoreductase [Oceaniferula flavus]MBM1135835.1 NAD(P)H-dependent oxidoreductase [Oceaniferula flavus]
MKLLAFGASTSSTSINQQLAKHAAALAASQLEQADVTELSLRDLDLPIYSEDEEKENGPPKDAQRFIDLIAAHDAIILSLAEHNGSYTAAFKNIYDWASRIEQKVWQGKPMLLLSSSPGARGGATVMEAGKATFPRMGAELAATFSLPQFYDTFGSEGINDEDLASQLNEAVDALVSQLR